MTQLMVQAQIQEVPPAAVLAAVQELRAAVWDRALVVQAQAQD